jgi:endoglucanase
VLALAPVVVALTGCSTVVTPGPAVEPPLGPSYKPVADPFTGRSLYVSDDLQAAGWAETHHARSWLAPILKQPQARWITGPSDLPALRRAARRAAREHTLLVVVAYSVPNRGCLNYREGSPDEAHYRTYIDGMVAALAPNPAVVILEPDAVAADCWSQARAAMLKAATVRLEAAGHHVYIDAGHDGWRSVAMTAQRLVQAGISEASGFAINVSARDTTTQSRSYGEELSDLVGSRPYLVDTSRNGLGPAPEQGGHSSWCNPDRQALGTQPDTTVIGHNIATLWIKNPGESDGTGSTCGRETAEAGLFSPRQARTLIAGASWVPVAKRRALPAESSLPWTK